MYEANCAMLYIDVPEMHLIHKLIDKKDIYDPPGETRYGLEKDIHITLLFGLDPSVPLSDIKKVIDRHTFVGGTILNASLFENDDYDVLKFDIDEASERRLKKVNKDLTKYPYKSEFDYHPHCTVAYINSGKGKKYMLMFQLHRISFVPTKAVYSEVNGARSVIKISTI